MSEPDASDKTRFSFRISGDDLAWLAEQAEDEGVDPATMVRMIVSRLRKGRPPLVSMMVAAPAQRVMVRGLQGTYEAQAIVSEAPRLDDGVVDDVLQQRLAELDGADVVPLHAEAEGETQGVAMPLRRVPRQQYNPGRR